VLVPLPYRLAGYGAYNLAFDKLLGRKRNPTDTDFFATIFNNGYRKINLVKVICFRWTQTEGLLPERAIPLYVNTPSGVQINQAFLSNLVTLVERAASYHFWVEVCIFHQQAIAAPDGTGSKPVRELPETLPPALMPRGANACQRLRNFFNPRPANPDQLALQKDLVKAIVTKLKDHSNVLFEIGNELRIAGSDPPHDCSIADNCALAEWLNIMGCQITDILDQTNSIGTSTGAFDEQPAPEKNEILIFNSDRTIYPPCAKPFSPGYFDFHFGQWYYAEDLALGMTFAKQRADAYKGRPTPLIINDDGTPKALRTLENYELWARTAFGLGAPPTRVPLHYLSKQKYPNGGIDPETGQLFDFNYDVMAKLNEAAKL
jgi:hypothetical protein